MPSSVQWLKSLECSTSFARFSDDSSTLSVVLNWLGFIFLSPCPQRILFSAVNLVFLLTLLVLALKRLYKRFLDRRNSSSSFLGKPLLGADRHNFRTNVWFKVSVIVVAVLALAHAVLSIVVSSHGIRSDWKLVEVLFELLQAIINVVLLVLILHEKKFGALSHPLSIRVYWGLSFVLVCLFSATAVARLVSSSFDTNMEVDDIFSLQHGWINPRW